MANHGQHFVAVVGGAISGSVAAEILADHGIRVAVIEQNKRPYGKIEDGLPRWHVEQRKQEYARIDARMKKPRRLFRSFDQAGPRHRPSRAFRMGLFRRDSGQRRLARPRFGRSRRGAIRRQGPGLPESVHLLVQPQERKGLPRAALRNAGRSSGGRRRAWPRSTW